MKRPEHDIQSFLMGYKPAYLHADDYHFPFQTKDEVYALQQYPRISDIASFNRPNQTLYFQNASLKNNFLRNQVDLSQDSEQLQYLLGKTLGYPPKAVDFFVQTTWKGLQTPDKISMNYCGFGFISSILDLKENVTWLWNKYKYDGIIKVQHGKKEHKKEWRIPYLENSILKQIEVRV